MQYVEKNNEIENSYKSIKIKIFHLFLFILILTLFSPELVTRTSIRIDTILIYFIVPTLVIIKPKIIKKKYLQLVLILSFMPFCFFISALGQSLITSSLNMDEFSYFFGILRAYFFFIFSLIAIKTYKQIKLVTNILIIALLFHSITTIIVYYDIEPIRSLIKIYFNTTDIVNTKRSLGSFGSLHWNAYYLLFNICILIILFPSINSKFYKYLVLMISLFAIILTLTKGALIGLAIFVILNYFLRFKTVFFLFKISILFCIVFLIFILLPENIQVGVYKVVNLYEIIISTIIGEEGIEYFASFHGRLQTLERVMINFQQSPLFGMGKSSLESGFIGDAFFMSILAQNGLIGIIGFIFPLIIFCIFFYKRKKNNSYAQGGYAFMILPIFVNFSGGTFTGRLMELMPILIIIIYLIVIGNFRESFEK